ACTCRLSPTADQVATSIPCASCAAQARGERFDLCHDRNQSGSGAENRGATRNCGGFARRRIAGVHEASLVAVAQKPATLFDADRLRRVYGLLVPFGRDLETAALLPDARSDRGLARVVQQGSDLRPIDLCP